MWKAALAGTAALAIVGSSLVIAQERERPGGFGRFQPSIDDMRAFADARMAALHAGLGLSADQEKNWPAFEQAWREMSKLRLDRVSAAVRERRERTQAPDDPAARLQRRAAALTDRGTALKKVADAFDPLYKSLDDAQKRRFAVLERFMGAGQDGRPRLDPRDRGGFERGPGRDGGPNFPFRRRTDYLPQPPQGGEERL
jgi:LTXXQ motif family protein